MAKALPDVPPFKLTLYDQLIATDRTVVRKGAANPYTSRNGHMFSFLTKAGSLALRLPKAEREAFLEKFNATLCVQHNTVMKDYVLVPERLFEDTRAIKTYFDQSVAYVNGLKPKPTTKKKTATKKAPKVKKKKTWR